MGFEKTKALAFVASFVCACAELQSGSGHDPTLAIEDEPASGAGGSAVDDPSSGAGGDGGEASDPQSSPPAAGFQGFTIPLDLTVTVGAFVLEIAEASVIPSLYLGERRVMVTLEFDASSTSIEVLEPLDCLHEEDVLLEIGGKFTFGRVIAEEVPGLRQGAGSITWSVPNEGFTVEQIRSGVITLGGAGDNAVVIPLNDPAATVSMNDIPLEVAFTIEGHREATLEITSARVQFGVRGGIGPYDVGWTNCPLGRETARLVLAGSLGAAPNGENWLPEHAALLRPDDISVPPYHLNELIYDYGLDNLEIHFPIKQPISGMYEFVLIDEVNGESAPQVIVVP